MRCLSPSLSSSSHGTDHDYESSHESKTQLQLAQYTDSRRFAADQPRPTTHLEMIKFVCKDLWTRVFRKQIDNLKTNHRGTFVLTDARFQPLSRMSADRRLGPKGVEQAVAKAQAFLWFPCGVIRGALQGLGMNVTVNAESTDLPIATFQIRLVGAKP